MVYPDHPVHYKLKTSNNGSEIPKSTKGNTSVNRRKIPQNQKTVHLMRIINLDGQKTNLDEDRIPTEELKLLHGIRMKRDHRVIIVDCFIDNKPIWGFLPLQNGGTEVSLRTFAGETQKENKISGR